MRLETKSLFICFLAYSLFLGLSGGAWGKDDPFPSDVKNVAISIRDVDGMEQFPLRVDVGKGSALDFRDPRLPNLQCLCPRASEAGERVRS